MSSRIPVVKKCCGFITDLRSAVIMIAVYGIVTCPPISWALMRHTYVIRVSSIVAVNRTQQDVIDINVRNIVSIGLGVNAGYETSAFSRDSGNSTKKQENTLRYKIQIQIGDIYVKFLKCMVWIVFMVDVSFLVASGLFLYKIFKVIVKKVVDLYIYSTITSTAVSFFYAMVYVIACNTSGTGFPILEFLFCIIDLVVWIYFILVIRSYRNTIGPVEAPAQTTAK